MMPCKVAWCVALATHGDTCAVHQDADPSAPRPTVRFDGETYQADRDGERLARQQATIYALMRDGRPRTLAQIEALTGFPQSSISARLRDLRKPRFGGHDVIRAYEDRGVWVYRVVLAQSGTQQEMF